MSRGPDNYLEAPPSADDERVQISLLTGFLGSGKTTLLNALLKHPEMGETAVLVNEFGEIGIDHQLIEKIDEETILLNAGCLCCSVRGDLARALRELSVKRARGEIPRITRVLIESTGLADPAPIIQTLISDPIVSERFTLDGIVTTIDAVLGEGQFDDHEESVKQVAVADRIVMTKCDLATAEGIKSLDARLTELNPAAPVTRALHGEIHPDQLFNAGLYDPATKSLDVQRWLRDEAYGEDGHHHSHDVNRHDANIRAFCITYDEPLVWEAFVAWVRTLTAVYGAKLLRIKGIVNIQGQENPIAIHGVQHMFHDPVELPAWPDDDRRSRMVFITNGLDPADLEKKLTNLQNAATGETGSPKLIS
ncbi:MAG: GTP-binding protein [Rhodospirillales bacterium]|nr:GTP-binding protein [Rhodospirillales bacterium]